MPETYFFDTSAFFAVIKGRPEGPQVSALIDRLNRQQCYTSVLVAYELYRGIPAVPARRKYQERMIDLLLEKFTRKAVTHAHSMMGAKVYRHSAGDIDPILAAQCLDGDYTMVTINVKHFENVPGIRLFDLN